MKFILLASLVFVSAVVHARPSASEMTCAQTQKLIQKKGRVAINHGYSQKAGPLYDAYVSSRKNCVGYEKAVPAWLSTLDNESCRAGFTCVYLAHD